MAVDLSGRSTELAGLLAAHGARFTVVGSTARRLRGGACSPRDLDVVVAEDDLAGLRRALQSLGVTAPRRPARVSTPWGVLDVFVR